MASLFCFLMGLIFIYLGKMVILEFSVLSLFCNNIEGLVYFDWMTFVFMSCVLFISSMILNYTKGYMGSDLKIKRFIFLMSLFVFSMMFMIMGMNLVSVLLGWDGLGLVSYVLVIYYQNVKSFGAGMLTALSNRIGDAALLIGIALLTDCGSWNFLFQDLMDLKGVGWMIILAAMTKSAQLPFSSWLPAAMAAPTPVSSLVHSSTLVTAGVYLLIRLSPMLTVTQLKFLIFISMMTMFLAGLCANFEYDLKKIIALSTLSQLGMMILILSLGGSDLAFFHLLIHAFFKALLFMCAGYIIHMMSDFQDIRFMGGLVNFIPTVCSCMMISNFALCGLPFISGFYSKDLIAELLSMNVFSWFIYLLFYISVGLTVSYSMRLSYYIFWGDANFCSTMKFSEDAGFQMLKSMLGLVGLVIFMGSIFSWVLMLTPYCVILPFFMKILTLVCIGMGGLMGFELTNFMYYYQLKTLKFNFLLMFVIGMWNMPILSTFGVSPFFLRVGSIYFKKFDQGWGEYYGSQGLISIVLMVLGKLQKSTNSYMKIFLALLVFYFLIFLFI
uniref:NADH-ubiquinone oxidoreductase chain 5 n=1 Tax=Trypophloeus asperatus TaxID=1897477 RepID=A0A343A6C6_9CUCU|nr:NADH dehydrogenase subunit 5 [Trypophloeus asperatus]AOY40105.1 NADH dehydrogenase subunit 5 [Trypophloeus asperatus]